MVTGVNEIKNNYYSNLVNVNNVNNFSNVAETTNIEKAAASSNDTDFSKLKADLQENIDVFVYNYDKSLTGSAMDQKSAEMVLKQIAGNISSLVSNLAESGDVDNKQYADALITSYYKMKFAINQVSGNPRAFESLDNYTNNTAITSFKSSIETLANKLNDVAPQLVSDKAAKNVENVQGIIASYFSALKSDQTNETFKEVLKSDDVKKYIYQFPLDGNTFNSLGTDDIGFSDQQNKFFNEMMVYGSTEGKDIVIKNAKAYFGKIKADASSFVEYEKAKGKSLSDLPKDIQYYYRADKEDLYGQVIKNAESSILQLGSLEDKLMLLGHKQEWAKEFLFSKSDQINIIRANDPVVASIVEKGGAFDIFNALKVVHSHYELNKIYREFDDDFHYQTKQMMIKKARHLNAEEQAYLQDEFYQYFGESLKLKK